MENLHVFNRGDSEIAFNGNTLKIYVAPKGNFDNLRTIVEEHSDKYEEKTIDINTNKLNRLVLCVSNVCNLSCRYCYLGHDCSETSFMSETIAESSIDYILNLYKEGISYVQFFGGEPLLNLGVIKHSIDYLATKCSELSLPTPGYTLVTNGTLITKEAHELFNKYFANITISLDGEKATNDHSRVFKKGEESVYDSVVSKIKELNKNRKYKLNIQMTITEELIDSYKENLTDYLHLLSLGVDNIFMCPLIESDHYKLKDSQTYRSKVHDYFMKCNAMALDNINHSNYHRALKLVNVLKKKEISSHFCTAGIDDITIDSKGNIYPCFMFLGNDEFIMDNILKPSSENFELNRATYIANTICSIPSCKNCWANKICSMCHSGCIGSNYLQNGAINIPSMDNCVLSLNILEETIYKISCFANKKGLVTSG